MPSAPPSPLDRNLATSHPNCDLCHYPPWNDTNPILVTGDEYASIAASACHGCPGCTLFQHAFDFAIRYEDQKDDLILFIRAPRDNNSFSLSVDGNFGSINFDVFTVEGEHSVPNIRVARMLPEKTHLEESLGIVKRWLQSCEERHALCGQENGCIPMRLLDVGVGEGESGEMVRLVMTDGWGGSSALPRYACLSHCWGAKKPNNMTKRETLMDNMRGIPFEELPRTFQDAVSVTRALGIDYLWIDSLCIVQDDEGDWAAHVEVMANVYQNAYITLAAGASEDSEGGFFRTADKIYADPKSIEVPLHRRGSVKATIYLRQRLSHIDEKKRHNRMPLETRGWAFQERLLSRRFLCFGAHEVQWECHEETACSCSTTTDGFNNRRNDGKPSFPLCSATKYELVRIKTMDREEISTLWREIVEQYNTRQLTYIKDKLPALAGLANIFAAATQDEYAYGLWLGTMKEDLAWRVISRGGRRQSNAPSWSWISAADNHRLHWSSKKLLHSTVQIHGLQEERLELSGHIAPVSLFVSRKTNDLLKLDGYVVQRVSMKPIYPESPPYKRGRSDVYPDYTWWDDTEDLNTILEEVYLLELGCLEDHHRAERRYPVGLILRKRTRTADDTPCAYERIGFIYSYPGIDVEWKPVGEYLRIQIV